MYYNLIYLQRSHGDVRRQKRKSEKDAKSKRPERKRSRQAEKNIYFLFKKKMIHTSEGQARKKETRGRWGSGTENAKNPKILNTLTSITNAAETTTTILTTSSADNDDFLGLLYSKPNVRIRQEINADNDDDDAVEVGSRRAETTTTLCFQQHLAPRRRF